MQPGNTVAQCGLCCEGTIDVNAQGQITGGWKCIFDAAKQYRSGCKLKRTKMNGCSTVKEE